MHRFTATPPLALYIHFPWCESKCPYCDFNSHALKDTLPEQAYIDALLRDLEQELPSVWGRVVHSIFLGGGTPSLFSPRSIELLLAGVRARLPIQPDAEITLEANPGSVEQSRFSGYREAGVNRLSIGIQSFDDRKLTALGRVHNARQARNAVQAAHAAEFDNFNIDIMFGLPEQGTDQALSDLHQAIELQPRHISWYQLTLEPNTLFFNRPPALPDDDRRWDMHQRGLQTLESAGYSQYEVSAFAQQGRRCRHNLNYWRFGDYLGIGAGAHAKITDTASQRIVRSARLKHPDRYLELAGNMQCISMQHTPDADETVFEFALNHLRLREGFSLQRFEHRCGLDREILMPGLEQAIQQGLLEIHDDTVLHTQKGWLFLDNLVQLFLPEAEHA